MMCENCLERPATIYLTKIINGNKTQINLCSKCAKQGDDLGFGVDFNLNLQDFISGMVNFETPAQTLKCSKCGLDYNTFSKNGRLGCSECYLAFQRKVDPIIKKIHKSSRHIGKVPKRAGGKIRVLKLMGKLKEELQSAIQTEEFEKAAELRDKIKELERSGLQGGE